MLRKADARRGGMPLYKFVGNRILTTLQNRLLRSHLGEWHSGYRLYSTDALRAFRFISTATRFISTRRSSFSCSSAACVSRKFRFRRTTVTRFPTSTASSTPKTSSSRVSRRVRRSGRSFTIGSSTARPRREAGRHTRRNWTLKARIVLRSNASHRARACSTSAAPEGTLVTFCAKGVAIRRESTRFLSVKNSRWTPSRFTI
jgi:hypothetical protein